MEENKEAKPGEEQAKEPKPKKVAVPTQKTFTFRGGTRQDEIDKTINPWLRSMTLAGQMPFLGKVSSVNNLFSSKIIYVFLFNTYLDMPKNETRNKLQ